MFDCLGLQMASSTSHFEINNIGILYILGAVGIGCQLPSCLTGEDEDAAAESAPERDLRADSRRRRTYSRSAVRAALGSMCLRAQMTT